MSCVFLTEHFVWKLKKPVRYDYLDFSTVEARKRNCELEVELNRRLAPDVYLGAVPLSQDANGQMQLGGQGRVIDWLVWMRRLPENKMLDAAIVAHAASHEDAKSVGKSLATFYKQATRVLWSPEEYVNRLEAATAESVRELRRPEYALPAEVIDSVHASQLSFLKREAALLGARVRQGKLVDAHGDLRPEHICLVSPPVIIDCLEFNAEFRVLDPVSELAFLSLECDRLGAPWVGDDILATYRRETDDCPSEPLLVFYKRHHACLRAKIAVWHLRDSPVRDAAKWIAKAKDYLLRAQSLEQFHN
jgi:aminoglycoside phosphotransferase family enzyme